MFSSKKLRTENAQLKRQLDELQAQHQAQVAQLNAELSQAKQQLIDEESDGEVSAELMLSSLKGGEMLQAIRTGMIESAQALADENQQLDQLDEMFSQTHHALSRLDNRAEKIRSQAAQSSESVTLLDNSTNAIRQLVSSIQEISDQTNLLALNAAIEAACFIFFRIRCKSLFCFIWTFLILFLPCLSPPNPCLPRTSSTPLSPFLPCITSLPQLPLPSSSPPSPPPATTRTRTQP